MRIMCLMPSTGEFDQMKWRSPKCSRENTILSHTYPIHGSAGEVNHLGAYAKVDSSHRYLVVCLPYLFDIDLFWHHLVSSESLTSTSIVMALCCGTAQKIRKHVYIF